MTAAGARKPAMETATVVDGEFAFTEGDFRKIAAMVHGDAGIALPDTKATLVYSRLAKRLRALGLANFQDYCALVAGAEGVDERQRMLAALTTNVTRFFREPHHFDHLREKVLAPLLAAARAGRKVRLWSAACSSGRNPIPAMTTIAAPDAASLDIRILATDIDPSMVAEARPASTRGLLAGVSGHRAAGPHPPPAGGAMCRSATRSARSSPSTSST